LHYKVLKVENNQEAKYMYQLLMLKNLKLCGKNNSSMMNITQVEKIDLTFFLFLFPMF